MLGFCTCAHQPSGTLDVNKAPPLTMIGDTVAMSTPHEVEYTVTFHSETLESAESGK